MGHCARSRLAPHTRVECSDNHVSEARSACDLVGLVHCAGRPSAGQRDSAVIPRQPGGFARCSLTSELRIRLTAAIVLPLCLSTLAAAPVFAQSAGGGGPTGDCFL